MLFFAVAPSGASAEDQPATDERVSVSCDGVSVLARPSATHADTYGDAVFVIPGTESVATADRLTVDSTGCTVEGLDTVGEHFDRGQLDSAGLVVDDILVGHRPTSRAGLSGAALGWRPNAGPAARAAALMPLPGDAALSAEGGGGPWGAAGALEIRTHDRVTSRVDVAGVDGSARVVASGDQVVDLAPGLALTFDGDIGRSTDRATVAMAHGRARRIDPFAVAGVSATSGPAHIAIAYRAERARGSRFDGADLDLALDGPAVLVRPSADVALTAGAESGGSVVGAAARSLWELPLRARAIQWVPRVDGRLGGVSRHATTPESTDDIEFVAAAVGGTAEVALLDRKAADLRLVFDGDWTSTRTGSDGDAVDGLFEPGRDGGRAAAGVVTTFGDAVTGFAHFIAEGHDDHGLHEMRLAVHGGRWRLEAAVAGDVDGPVSVDRGTVSAEASAEPVSAGVRWTRVRDGAPTPRLGPLPLRTSADANADGDSLVLDWTARVGATTLQAELGWSPRDHGAPIGGAARVDVATRRAGLGVFAFGGKLLDVDQAGAFVGVRLGDHAGSSWMHAR